MEAEILFRVTKKPPGIDNGDGWLYNMVNGPDATIHLKMIKLVNCRLYHFYHIKKTEPTFHSKSQLKRFWRVFASNVLYLPGDVHCCQVFISNLQF